MAAEVKKEIQLEIAHVLFTDIVGYSKLPINQQRAVVERLNEIVGGTDEYQAAETAGRLIKIPTGDGITLSEFGFILGKPVRRLRKNVRSLFQGRASARIAAGAYRLRL